MECEFMLGDDYFRVAYEIQNNSFDHEFGKETRHDLVIKNVLMAVPYINEEWIDLTKDLTEIARARLTQKIALQYD